MYSITTATRKVASLTKRIRAVQGGTSAGKTVGILEYLIDKAQSDEEPTITSVVSESFPHLRRGAIRDFLSIMESHGYFEPSYWNKTEFIYSFPEGSKIEFFSVDQPGKVRGPRRDVLFINEANNISFESYTQLAIRTNEDIYIDYNPVSEFWVRKLASIRSNILSSLVSYPREVPSTICSIATVPDLSSSFLKDPLGWPWS